MSENLCRWALGENLFFFSVLFSYKQLVCTYTSVYVCVCKCVCEYAPVFNGLTETKCVRLLSNTYNNVDKIRQKMYKSRETIYLSIYLSIRHTDRQILSFFIFGCLRDAYYGRHHKCTQICGAKKS